MSLITISSISGYLQRPDYELQIFGDGRIQYNGYYFVGITGHRKSKISQETLKEIRGLAAFLYQRNQKNYLKKDLDPGYRVRIEDSRTLQFEIDAGDIVSDDIILQILDLSSANQWIQAKLALYLIMNKPGFRSKELAIVQAAFPVDALNLYSSQRPGLPLRPETDFIVIKVGEQNSAAILHPVIYFSFTDYQIMKPSSTLFLNQGSKLNSSFNNIFLYISFGKRYNDPSGSYHMVLAQDAHTASIYFKTFYPHFMSNDFQQVDLSMRLIPTPLFSTHIPIAIR